MYNVMYTYKISSRFVHKYIYTYIHKYTILQFEQLAKRYIYDTYYIYKD